MKTYLTTPLLSFALIAVAPTFAEEADKKESPEAKEYSENHQKMDKKDAENTTKPIVKKGPNKPSDYTKAAEDNVDSEVNKLRQNIIVDAVEAVIETNKVLISLEKGQVKEASAFLKTAIDKLKAVLKSEPALGLKPIHTMKSIHDLQADPAIIKKKIEAAEKHLKEGELQQARMLISPLVSDITISTTSIPLGTYPESLKAIAPLIDEGKIQEAKIALQTLLSTLITKDLVIPLPPLRAKAMLMEAEVLVENEKRTEEENQKLKELLKLAHNEIKVSELLGYGNKEAFKPMHDLINDIEKKMKEGKGGKGWFDDIKKAWAALFSADEAAK